MDAWARHALTADERERFERDGFLLVRGALDAQTCDAVCNAARRHDEAYRQHPGVTRYHVLNLHDLIGREPIFTTLVDHPTTFPKVFGILGWNIQCFHTQLLVTPPSHPDAPDGGYAWHQDNNRMNLDFETPPPHPRVSVKIGYFPTPLPRTGMANLCVVPGSHRRGRPDLDLFECPDGAIEVTADVGDALIFDRRLWHAGSTNHSEQTRVFLTYGYAYRWLRPKSAMAVEQLLPDCDPIRRQLLGASPSGANGYFDPTDDDVPLRAWIRDHLADEAPAP